MFWCVVNKALFRRCPDRVLAFQAVLSFVAKMLSGLSQILLPGVFNRDFDNATGVNGLFLPFLSRYGGDDRKWLITKHTKQ